MKKFLIALGILGFTGKAFATHLQGLNASNISIGTLDSARLDPSSVTMYGPNIPISAIAGVVNFTNTGVKPYSIVLGTLTALNVDIASNTESGLSDAIALLCGSSNTVSCPSGGTIFMKPGIYSINIATIPANIHVYAVPGSSVVWLAGSGSAGSNTITNYGWIEGIDHNGRNASIASWPYMRLMTGSKWTNFTGTNWNMASNINAKIFQVEQASNVVVNGSMSNFNIPAVVAAQNDSAPFAVKFSSDVDVVLNTNGCKAYQTNSGAFRIEGSARIKLHDSRWPDAGGAWIGIQNQNIDIEIRNNFMNINADNDGSGAISLAGVGSNPVTQGSTGTVIAENRFMVSSAGTGNPIINFGNTGGAKMAVVRGNDVVSAQDLNGANFVFIVTRGTSVVGLLAQHNRLYNRGPGTGLSFIGDSGTGTNFTGATGGNYTNSVQQ